MKSPRLHLLALACALAATSCAKQDSAVTASDVPSGALGEAAQKAAETTKVDALPKPDMNRPLSGYPELKDGQQVMFMYVAASRLPPDFEKLAESFSREYRETSDSFRKQDLLKALRPQLEQGIAQAAATPYAWVELDDAKLQAYDFTRKGFPIEEFDGRHRRYFTDASTYNYAWINNEQVRFVPVADEAIARELESMRTKWNTKPHLKVFFFAQSADLNRNTVNAYVTRVQITDKSGRVLAEYGPDQTKAAQPEAEAECGSSADCAAQAAIGF